MTLKQSSDKTENFRLAIKSFRSVIDILSCPLPSALGNIFFAERLGDKFNISLPLTDFTLFDALQPEANVDRANKATIDKTAEGYRSTNLERLYPAKSRGETRENATQAKDGKQDRKIDPSQIDTSSKKYGSGNIVMRKDTAQSTSRVQQLTVRETSPETPGDHNKKPIRQNSGFSALTATTPDKVSFIEPSPGSSNPCQIQVRDMDAVKNTLIVVDNLAQQILHDEHQPPVKQKEVHSSSNQPSLHKRSDQQLQRESNLSANRPLSTMTPLRTMPQGETLAHAERQKLPQRKNEQTDSYRRVTEETRSKESHFNENNFTNSYNYKSLPNSISQIGSIADALLQSSATGNGVKVKEQNISSARENERTICDSSGSSAGDFNSNHNMKLQQTKGSSLLSGISNATKPVLRDAVSVNSMDKDTIVTFVNEVLVEQAKRHGVDLS